MLSPADGSSLPEGLRRLADAFLAAYPKQQDYIPPYVYAFYLREGITEEDQGSILSYLRWWGESEGWRAVMATDPAMRYLPSAAKFLERWKRWRGSEAAQKAFEGGGQDGDALYDLRFRPVRLIGTEDLLGYRERYGRFGLADEAWDAELARRQANGEPVPADIPEEGKAEAPKDLALKAQGGAAAAGPDIAALAKVKSVEGAIEAAEAKNGAGKEG